MFKNLLIIVAAVCGSAQANSVTVSAPTACSNPLITPDVTEISFTLNPNNPGEYVEVQGDGSVIDSCALFNNLPENGLRVINPPAGPTLHDFIFLPGQPIVIENIYFNSCFFYGLTGADVTFINCTFQDCFIGSECGMKFTGNATVLNSSTLFVGDLECGLWPIPEFTSPITVWDNVTVEARSSINSTGVVRCPNGMFIDSVLTNKVQGPLLFTSDSVTPVYAAGASQVVVYPQLFGVELADLDGDGVIGFGDQSLVLSRWGQACGVWNDPNQDGVYDFADLQVVNSLWGQTY